MPIQTPAALQPGQLIAGKYRIDRVLGEGGMGQVLLATHVDLHEHCAVKILHRDALSHPDAYERFVREARVARQLKSLHAVKVYDFGRLETGEPYIVMEFLEGVDLKALLVQRGPLPVSEAALYVTQACEAIGEAHAAGIIHRDLKPANLFLTRGLHGRPCIKVLDFGIAKMAGRPAGGPEREMTGNAMMGTLAYMSPEQMLSSRSVDHRADIWSMGVVLFRLLANALPFEDDGDGLAIVNQVINGTPASLASVDPTFPPGLCAAVTCCLQKDREHRYQTAMELADALSPFVVPEPRPSNARASRWEHTVESSTARIPASRPSSSISVSSSPVSGSSARNIVTADNEKTTTFVPVSERRAPFPAMDPQTSSSWSKTGRRTTERRSRLWLVAGALVLLIGAGVALWRFLRSPDIPGISASDPALSSTAMAPAAPPAPVATTVPTTPASPGTAQVDSPGAVTTVLLVTPNHGPARGSSSGVTSKPAAQPTVSPTGGALQSPAAAPPSTRGAAPPTNADPFADDRK